MIRLRFYLLSGIWESGPGTNSHVGVKEQGEPGCYLKSGNLGIGNLIWPSGNLESATSGNLESVPTLLPEMSCSSTPFTPTCEISSDKPCSTWNNRSRPCGYLESGNLGIGNLIRSSGNPESATIGHLESVPTLQPEKSYSSTPSTPTREFSSDKPFHVEQPVKTLRLSGIGESGNR
jgi:hypothetical protein